MGLVANPPMELRDAHRRNAWGAAQHSEVRQGALYRSVLHVRVAIHEGVVSCGTSRLDAIRFHAKSLQPALSRRRTRDDAAVPSRGHRCTSVESARAWTSSATVADREHKTLRDGPVRQAEVPEDCRTS